MDIAERMKNRIENPDVGLIADCIESAKSIYLSRRFPFVDPPTREVTIENDDGTYTTYEETYVEPRYEDWQYRCAMALYAKDGAEGQLSHSENGISRSWGSESVPKELLTEIPPYVGIPR